MFNQTVMMARSTQKWLNHGKKKESVVNKPLSKDYRNIIEGLQVRQDESILKDVHSLLKVDVNWVFLFHNRVILILLFYYILVKLIPPILVSLLVEKTENFSHFLMSTYRQFFFLN